MLQAYLRIGFILEIDEISYLAFLCGTFFNISAMQREVV